MNGIFQRGFLAAVGLAVFVTVAGAQDYRGYEVPPYVVERSDGDFELRRYAPHVLAEVLVAGGRASAVGRGFRVLAGYIFGGNASGAKIAMTTPVTQAEMAPDQWSVTFMMPAARVRSALPAPDNAAIRFRKTEPVRQLSVRFSGRMSASRIAQQEARLRAYALANGLATEGPLRMSYYDDPFTLPWKRRNEVALAIK